MKKEYYSIGERVGIKNMVNWDKLQNNFFWISIRGNLKEDKEGNIVGGLKL